MDLEYERFRPYFYNVVSIIMTEEDNENHANATRCFMCLEDFIEGDTIVADHDHINGKYRGAAHGNCNLKARQQKRMIIYMHNAKG